MSKKSHHKNSDAEKQKKDDVQEKEVQKEENEVTEMSELDSLKAEKSDLEDLLKRKVAEFDNYKKRVIREKEEFRVLANKSLILEILPIIDNFDRALKAANQNQNFEAMMEGLKMVHGQMENLLSNNEVKPIEALGQEFDPNLHEAYMVEETEDEESANKVIDEFEKGYRMGGGVLRHSKVKVAKKA